MAIYSYVKRKPKRNHRLINFISYLFLIFGCFFLFYSLYPLISFEIYAQIFLKNKTISPVPRSDVVSSLEAANSVLGAYQIYTSTNLSDFTKAGIWFPSRPQPKERRLMVKEYTLSIPKLNIVDAKVVVGGEDLSKSLVHYLPQTLPGEYGNVSIFGHSSLPQLYNVSDYKTIFTYLPFLEKGDRILIKIDGLTYEYQVYEMFVVEPNEISVLDQRYDNAYLTLITCVPPGTYLKRLVVRAKLLKL